jgi:chromosome segregation ATPase
MQTNNTTLERRMSEVDAGSQQLLEKLRDMEKDIENKMSDNSSSLQSRLNILDSDNKKNTLQIVNIQESIHIQSEEAKKVESERHASSVKVKEDLAAAVASNERAISDLKIEFDESITHKFKPTEDMINNIDGKVEVINKTVAVFESRHLETIEKFKEVSVITNTIQTQVKAQEAKMVEQNTNDLNQIKEHIDSIDNKTVACKHEIESVKNDSQTLMHYIDRLTAEKDKIAEKLVDTDNKLDIMEETSNGFDKELKSYLSKTTELQTNYQTNSIEIKNLTEANNRYIQHIQDVEILSDKVSNMEDVHNRAQSKIQTELIANITQNYDDMKSFCESSIGKLDSSYSVRIKNLEEESKDASRKIVEIQDFAMKQEEKSKFVESLSSRVSHMDEMRQQSEAKTNQEVEARASRNAVEIQEMRTNIENTLGELERGMKAETNSIRSDNLDIRRDADYIREQLANYEDVIDKRINTDMLQNRINSKSTLVILLMFYLLLLTQKEKTEKNEQIQKVGGQ